MIVIPRRLARSVRELARRCVSGRPRGPAPPAAFERRAGTLTAWVRTADATPAYAAPDPGPDALLVAPLSVLDAVEGPGDDPIELAAADGLRGEARWRDRGVPRAHPFEAILPGKQHHPPEEPGDWQPASADLLTALHECGRTAARESGRYALTRVQVRGRAGEVAGTDGRTALVWGGLAFPFPDDLLVPAVPVFGCRELAREPDVRVGRTTDSLVVGAGPWRVHLPVDATGRFPDLAAVLRRDAPTVAGIDEKDVAELLARLPGLPGADAEHRPVTLVLDGGVTVLARDAAGAVGEVRLARSPAAGPAARVGVARRALARALALGCVTVRAAPGRPVVFEGADRTLVTVALDPLPEAGAHPTEDAATTPDPPPTARRIAMRPTPNGHPPAGPADPAAADPPDPLAAAEDLRAALADAGLKAGRLVAALKARRKEQRVLTQAWSSLKALGLGRE